MLSGGLFGLRGSRRALHQFNVAVSEMRRWTQRWHLVSARVQRKLFFLSPPLSQGDEESFTLKSCTRRKTDSIEKRFCFDVEAVDRWVCVKCINELLGAITSRRHTVGLLSSLQTGERTEWVFSAWSPSSFASSAPPSCRYTSSTSAHQNIPRSPHPILLFSRCQWTFICIYGVWLLPSTDVREC